MAVRYKGSCRYNTRSGFVFHELSPYNSVRKIMRRFTLSVLNGSHFHVLSLCDTSSYKKVAKLKFEWFWFHGAWAHSS